MILPSQKRLEGIVGAGNTNATCCGGGNLPCVHHVVFVSGVPGKHRWCSPVKEKDVAYMIYYVITVKTFSLYIRLLHKLILSQVLLPAFSFLPFCMSCHCTFTTPHCWWDWNMWTSLGILGIPYETVLWSPVALHQKPTFSICEHWFPHCCDCTEFPDQEQIWIARRALIESSTCRDTSWHTFHSCMWEVSHIHLFYWYLKMNCRPNLHITLPTCYQSCHYSQFAHENQHLFANTVQETHQCHSSLPWCQWDQIMGQGKNSQQWWHN